MARFTAQSRKRQLTPSRQRANYLARQERDFLAQLISLRKEAGLTQQDVAEKLGVSQQAISKFESMDSSPTLSTALSYAHAVQALVHFEAVLDEGRFETYGEDWITSSIADAPAQGAQGNSQDIDSPGEATSGSNLPFDITPEHFITADETKRASGTLRTR